MVRVAVPGVYTNVYSFGEQMKMHVVWPLVFVAG